MEGHRKIEFWNSESLSLIIKRFNILYSYLNSIAAVQGRASELCLPSPIQALQLCTAKFRFLYEQRRIQRLCFYKLGYKDFYLGLGWAARPRQFYRLWFPLLGINIQCGFFCSLNCKEIKKKKKTWPFEYWTLIWSLFVCLVWKFLGLWFCI